MIELNKEILLNKGEIGDLRALYDEKLNVINFQSIIYQQYQIHAQA